MSRKPRNSKSAVAPLGAHEFGRLMAALGATKWSSFAVAVSGGPDSLALCLLAAAWCHRRRRELLALTVDHDLRPEAAAEARQVAAWLAGHGIRHRVLRWRGAKPKGGLPAAAREARYSLLLGCCRRRGIAALLLGHQLEDQAETLLLRLGRGSGVDGLAAMAPASERDGMVLLRPLLGIPRARLIATLEARRQPWLEDPSNRDPSFARSRLRQALAALGDEAAQSRRLAATAASLRRARLALEAATGELLRRAALLDEAGGCRLEAGLLTAAPEEIGLRALARVLMCVGGRVYPPRLAHLERALAGLGQGRTLAGCRLLPGAAGLLVVREAARAEAVELKPGREILWDGRFRLRLASAPAGPYRATALGSVGWRTLRQAEPRFSSPHPAPVRAALPALWRGKRLLAVPGLGYRAAKMPALRAVFAPQTPLIPSPPVV